MCGFTGFYVAKAERSRGEYDDIVRTMANVISRRGPDHGDAWQDPDVTLALGHRRLSILDLSEHGHQPMASSSERFVIAYNGEIYNHLDLRQQYLADFNFKGHSDTETLLALVETLGFEKTLDVINGMFAFALWDRKERVLHCARDRFGKKPLYVGWVGSHLVFGSELKSFHAHPDFKGQIDHNSLALYTQYNCIPAPSSIYQDIWQLKPAHMLSLDIESLKKGADLSLIMKSYWSAEEIAVTTERPPIDAIDAVEAFEDLLMQCVKDRMLSDVPLGAFLSGGIDSSSVVALMSKVSTKPVHTYTIGFNVAGYNEADHARDIAQHLGTEHHEHICLAQDTLDIIPKLANIYDEPFADQSAIPTYLISQFARQDVTVALSGDGGDEMLGGYNRHVSTPKIASLPSFLSGCINTLPASLLKTVFPQKPLLKKHLDKASAILSAERRDDIYNAILQNWNEAPVPEKSDIRLNIADSDTLNLSEQLMLWDTQHYLPNDILTKVDRASMAVSLEARAPLLDKRIFEYVWSLPINLKIKNGTGKWLLREVLARHVPRSLFERSKQGFNMPIGAWMREDLRELAEELLDHKKLDNQGLFDASKIRKIWDTHLNGHGHYDEALWNILMFQAWHKKWH